MSTIIRTRSPFFIRTTNYAPPTYDIDYFRMSITIFEGPDSASIPTCGGVFGSYTLQKKVLPGETSVTFEISEIINDHFTKTFTGTYLTLGQNVTVAVVVTITGFETDGTQITPGVSNFYYAQEGYNDFKDGVNYTTQPILLLSENYIEYHKGSTINLPVNRDRVNSISWRLNGSQITGDTFASPTDSTEVVEYSSFATTSQQYDEVVVTYDTSDTVSYTLKEIEECKYPVHKITFVNRWGAYQDLFFHKKSVETLDTTSESFNKSIFKPRTVTFREREDCEEVISYNSYSTFEHSKKTHNANGTESIQLNSGFVDERMNSYFEELMVSEYIWLTDDQNVVYPVTLKDSNFTYKTGLNDRLINYTMNFEKAFNLVNNIR
tara:strand:- start:2430 stop:3566 length:1137 start_codon:yes stop_codon:yes gene_type:complete